MMRSETRLTELESQLAHTARTLEELSAVIHRQQKEIDTLTRRVTALLQRAADTEADNPPADRQPPHY